jgi:class 3 adenylate cyclase/tetratricopeptide (TPR) repeat protein
MGEAGVSQDCRHCGAPLPAGARFCPQCGARVAPTQVQTPEPPQTSSAGERRPVAVLFADLSGYTRLSSALDPEDVHRLLGRYFGVVDGVVQRLGGTIDKHIGDAVMGVFGAPVALGNDVERAVRAACEIHAAVAALSAEFGRPLRAHVGVACGEVVAAATGSDAHHVYTVTGDAVNLAARLTDLAQAGETAVSDEVRQIVDAVVEMEALGAVPIRGLDHDVPVWRVTRLRTAATSKRVLIGRDVERARFDELLDRTGRAAAGFVAALRADPGMGKTTLAAALVDAARERGFACHVSAVLDFGTGQGRDAVHVLCCSVLGIAVGAAGDQRRAALDRALATGAVGRDGEPFIADLLALAQREGSLYDAMDNAARQRGRARALADIVERASAHAPQLVLVEDVHWASAGVLACLAEVAGSAARHRIGLLMTTRRDGDPIESVLPGDAVAMFDLAPLPDAEALALARVYLPGTDERLLRCIARAQGNPLFLTQLLQADADDESVPGTIQSAVLARLDRLSQSDKAALQAAAVIGQRFDPALLRRLIGDPGYDPRELVARDLVRVEPDHTGYTFAHALIRDGAYASLLHSARRALHRTAADWYTGRDLPLRAEHLDRAGDEGAASACLDAARAEAMAHRFDEALRYARRGAGLPAAADVGSALALFEGDLLRELGAPGDSVRAFERALALADSDAQRCRALVGIAAAHRLTSTIGAGLAALDRAEPLAQRQGLLRELAHIGYLRGSLHFAAGDVEACRGAHALAFARAQAAGDHECEAQALSGLADVLYAEGRLRSAYDAFLRCVAICDRDGLVRVALTNLCMLTVIHSFLDPADAALHEAQRAYELAVQMRHRQAEVMADESLGWAFLFCGRHDEAAFHSKRSLAVAREIGSRRFEAIDLTLLAYVHWQRGEPERARECLRDAWTICEEMGTRFGGALVQGGMAVMASSPAERSAALARGEALLAAGCPAHCRFWFHRDAVEATLAAGDWAAADRHATALEHAAAAEPLPWVDFHSARGHALAAAGRGDPDRAALMACRADAVRLHLAGALPALDAALRRAAPT